MLGAVEQFLSGLYLLTGWEPYTWLGMLVLASLLDAAATAYALYMQIGREQNKAMAWAMGKVGLVPALLLLKLPQIGTLFYTLQTSILWVPLWVGVYIAVVVWNLSVIFKGNSNG